MRLLLRVAGRVPDVRFLLVWRLSHFGKLQRLLAETGLANVEVQNGMIRDMTALYQRAHAAVLPALEYRALIEPTAEVDLSPAASWAQGCVISSFTKDRRAVRDGPAGTHREWLLHRLRRRRAPHRR